MVAGVEQLVGSTDEQLTALGYPQPEMVIPKLVLMHTAMTTLGVKEVHYQPSNGGCRGILSTPTFWE